MGWLLRNWHLKLAAAGLATVLYTGFVYSGSFSEQVFPGLPIEAINQPDGAFPLTQQLGTVNVQYRLSTDAAPSHRRVVRGHRRPVRVRHGPGAAAAVAAGAGDLPAGGRAVPQRRAEQRAGCPRPPRPTAGPGRGADGDVPEGLAIEAPRVSLEEVTASGPQSQLGRVDRAVARVQVFESGIDVRQPQVVLVPVDIDGREVESVELEPATVTVEIDVRTVATSKTVPIRPILTGSPADGFQVERGDRRADGGHRLRPAHRPGSGCGGHDRAGGDRQCVRQPGARRGAGAARLAQGWRTPLRRRRSTVTIRPDVATQTYLVGVTLRRGAGRSCLPASAVASRGHPARADEHPRRPRPGGPDAGARRIGPGSGGAPADPSLLAAAGRAAASPSRREP